MDSPLKLASGRDPRAANDEKGGTSPTDIIFPRHPPARPAGPADGEGNPKHQSSLNRQLDSPDEPANDVSVIGDQSSVIRNPCGNDDSVIDNQ